MQTNGYQAQRLTVKAITWAHLKPQKRPQLPMKHLQQFAMVNFTEKHVRIHKFHKTQSKIASIRCNLGL